jgi:hypothetical protein
MSADEKQLNNDIQSIFSQIQQIIQQKRKIVKEFVNEAEKRFDIPKNTWTPIMRSELPRFKRIIFDLIATAYAPIGGHSNVKDKDDLPDESDFIDVIDVDSDDEIDAATIAKHKPAGKKFVALGHDGSSAGKSAAVNHQVDKLKSGGYYVEVSGKMKDIFMGKGVAPVTDEDTVRRALKGKEFKWNGDGSYDRKIGGSMHTKMMFGKPK